MSFKFHLERLPVEQGFGERLYVEVREGTLGRRGFAQPVVFEISDPGALEHRDVKPAICDRASGHGESRAFLQAALDLAWEIGLRPSKDDSALAHAKDRHLEDMRRIAFHQLGIKP